MTGLFDTVLRRQFILIFVSLAAAIAAASAFGMSIHAILQAPL